MIVTSESIVLRARKQGETSKIITLYTRDFGKLNVIAKGARDIKSKFGASLEMFSNISAVFYKKEKEDALYLLSKADTLGSNAGISVSLEKMEAATAAVELIIRAMHDEEENQKIFELLRSTLQAMATIATTQSAAIFLFRFYFEFAAISGFQMKLVDEDDLPEEDLLMERRTVFKLASGELFDYVVSKTDETGGPIYAGIPITDEGRRILRSLDNATDLELSRMAPSERTRMELLDMFQAYFSNHLPGFTSRTLKSGRVFSGL